MRRALMARNWNFEVWFMARSEPDRNWTFKEPDFDFPHRFLRGVHWHTARSSWHVNLEVIRDLLYRQPEVLLVAGSWTMPTVWLAAFSEKAKTKIFWSESHLASIQQHDRISTLLRRFVLMRFKEFAVPGKLAREYVEANAAPVHIHRFPNLVDPELFRDRVNTLRQTVLAREGHENRTLLVVARLVPEKGLLQFLRGIRLLKTDESARLRIVIGGEGSQRRLVQEQAIDLGILLSGYKGEQELLNSYAKADGFCLPSISDPNPLAVIEAIWAGLPLLLSSRVGNHPECLIPEQNGFLFDPLRPESIAGAVSRWLSLRPEELEQFGNRSLEIAEREFGPEMVINSFLDHVLPNPAVSISGGADRKLARQKAAS